MTFPGKSKTAAGVPIFKSENKIDKENYRPVRILNFKMSLKIKSHHIETTFCLHLYLIIDILLRQIETWRYCLDQSKLFGIILIDLSKAFDCIPLDLLIAKLYGYRLDSSALVYIYSYSKERKQAVRINETYSTRIHFRTNPFQCFHK